MRKIFFLIAVLIPLIAFSQSARDWKDQIKDGYKTSSGWVIKKGDTLLLGKGSLPNKKFAYIYQSPIGWGSGTSYDVDDKKSLTSMSAGKQAIVKDLIVYGTKRSGFTIIAKVGVGEMVNYWVEIENAISDMEIVQPKDINVKVQQDQ